MAQIPAEQNAPQEPVTRADHHGSGVDHPKDDAKKKRPFLRVLLRIAIVLILVVAVLIALAPTLLSTGPGTRWLVSLVSNKTPGELTVDDLQLSWFGGQRVMGVTYDDPAQGLHAEVGEIDAPDLDLFSFWTGSRHLGKVQLSDAGLVYRRADLGAEPSPVDAPDEDLAKQPFALPQGLSGELVFERVTVSYESPGLETVVVSLAQGELEMPDLRDIVFQFDTQVRQGERVGRASFAGEVLNLFDPEGVAQAEQAAYDIVFDVQDVPTAALDQVVSAMSQSVKPGRVTAILGDGDMVANATVKGTIEQLTSDLSIETPKLIVKLEQRTEGGTLVASPESNATLKLDQSGFMGLFPQSGLKLVEPTQIELASFEMALPIVNKAVDWDKATAMLLVKAGANLAVVDDRGEVLGIDALRITGRSDSIADKLSFKLTTVLSAVDKGGTQTRKPVVVDLVVGEPLEATRQIDFFSEALPIQLADALSGQDGKIVLWLGEMLELQADVQGKIVTNAQGKPRIEQQFSLRPNGRVTGTISGTYRQGRFTLSTPDNEPVEATLTPQAFASLMEMLSGRPGEPALTIDQDMPVYLTIRDPNRGAVSITTRGDRVGVKRFFPDPDQTYLAAKIELSPARVFDPKLKKTYELRGGNLSLLAPDLRGKTQVRAELDLWVRPNAGDEGVAALLTWQTTVTDLLDTEGSVPLDGKTLMQQLSATGGLESTNVPSGLLDSLLNREGDFASIVGPFIQQLDAGFTYKDGQPTGATVRLNWDDASNQPLAGSWASMKPAAFDIDADQMLTVRGGQDLELEIKVTEQFGDRWMGKLHPILFDAKSGDRPVKVKIDGKSFRFPLQGNKMLGSRVDASVDMGTVEFGNDALLGKIMQWTKRPGQRAVFEPAKVSLVDGKISYDEFDLAVGKVKLRFDGEVDLTSGKIVDMAVRVPGDSLIRVFNELEGIIKPGDFLSIPMTGQIRKPTFDSDLIGREVARLVARGLLDQQKDNLKDLIRKGVGGDDRPKPKGDDAQPDGDEEQPPKSVEDALIDGALDLLLKRLGKDKKKQD